MEKKRIVYLSLGLLFLIIFIILAVFVKLGTFNANDLTVNSFFKSIEFGFGTKFMSFISFFGSSWFIGIFSLFLICFFYWEHQIQGGFFYLFNLVFGIGISFLVKEIVQRARPYNLIETDFSFPSDHVLGTALICFVFSWLYWKKDKKIAITLLFVPLLMGISRLYLNLHWFSDVLGSLFLAAGWFFLSVFVFWPYLKQK